MENGIYEGGSNQASVPSLTKSDFIAGFVKGKPGNHYSIKAGDPDGKVLQPVYDGPRPRGYELMKKQGARRDGLFSAQINQNARSDLLPRQAPRDRRRENGTHHGACHAGAIILGIGGDNSPWAAGTFYEGAMTYGFATNETEAAVFANIVAAGYGK
jgi:hypothetical protein